MELQSYPLSLTTTFLILLALFWLVKLSRSSRNIGHQKLPPGPWKLPVIGNLHNLAGSLPHHTLRDLARRHGPLMHLQLGEISAVIVSSPTLARDIMKNHDLCFAQRPQLLATEIVTYGGSDIAFAPYGEYWRQMRKVSTIELLSTKRVQSFSSVRQYEVQNLVDSIRASAGLINLTERIFSLVSSIVSRTAFGNKCRDQDAFVSLGKECISLSGGFDLVDLFPSNKFLRMTSPMRAKLERIHIKADQILENIFHEHEQKKMKAKQNGGDELLEEDLVDVLLRLQQSDNLEFPITMDNIKAVILVSTNFCHK